jgi:hypothetical protein
LIGLLRERVGLLLDPVHQTHGRLHVATTWETPEQGEMVTQALLSRQD